MQTFLPYVDFTESARVLDRQRLGKQRVETLQIMKALLVGKGWVNHPATKMWSGHESFLFEYQLAMCNEWARTRGYKDTCLGKTIMLMDEAGIVSALEPERDRRAPPWIGDEKFHASHRSNLLRKDPEWYGRFGWDEPPDMEYVWPV